MKKDKHNPHVRKRLARIERKCDIILSLLRPRSEEKELDSAIEAMHLQARRMKDLAAIEARSFREAFHVRKPRR